MVMRAQNNTYLGDVLDFWWISLLASLLVDIMGPCVDPAC